MRGLRLALQFLTRLPVGSVPDLRADELSRSAPWFPAIGLIIGSLLAGVVWLGGLRNGLLAGALGVLAWAWITGALHLDGLADLTDALAASHRDRERFLTVLADPHIGAFGAVSLVLVLLLKFALLPLLGPDALPGLILVPAWARLGPLAWGRWLPPLKAGQAERFVWRLDARWIAVWTALLLAASLWLAPALCAGPLVLLLWGVWLRRRLGGVTGDCLGAGVEVSECVLLAVLALTSGAVADPH